MRLMNSGGQSRHDTLYIADGTITAGGTAQLVLGRSMSRTLLKLQNLSLGPLYFEFGSARATATITNGAVTAVTVTNAGGGFSYAPVIEFLGGGGNDGPTANPSYLGLAQDGAPSPSRPAKARCIMTGSAPNMSVASIVIDNPGAKYLCPPYVFIRNSDLDPNGFAAPSATSGMLLSGQSAPFILNGTACHTDPVSVFGATTGAAYLCRWMT
jgi:hypothetical protein